MTLLPLPTPIAAVLASLGYRIYTEKIVAVDADGSSHVGGFRYHLVSENGGAL